MTVCGVTRGQLIAHSSVGVLNLVRIKENGFRQGLELMTSTIIN